MAEVLQDFPSGATFTPLLAAEISVVGLGERGLLFPPPDSVREPQNGRVEIVSSSATDAPQISMPQVKVPRHVTALVAGEDPGIRKLISRMLIGSGHRVHEASSCEEVRRAVTRFAPHLLILSLDTADCSGGAAMALLRGETEAPILALSSRDDEATVVNALNGGADDFLVKPFRSREFLARVGNILRRQAHKKGMRPIFVEGSLKVDIVYRRVWVGDREIHLGPKSYQLLRFLIENAGRVISHRELQTHLWGANCTDHTSYLRREVHQLRCAIEVDPANPQLITTEHHVGYRFIRSFQTSTR